ncbi:MAG: squalene/phytoene synthase family protein [Bacteroidales bacterium]|nr:squalene/phytoene synthase family protein [Lentimicrobiaceae bacterium]MDD5694897.1 squalene/phytoene synthase family protein [Bacteroidales bacterium]
MDNIDVIVKETLGKIDFHHVNDHPNILIAARFWDDDRYQAARTIYRFMRYIDDMIDDRKALATTLTCLEQKMFADQVNSWIDCLGLDHSIDPFSREVTATIQRFRIPLHFFYNFARSMVYDISHDGFRTIGEFIDYAEGASNGPASVFVHLCCLEKLHGEYVPARLTISDVSRPCALFSYLVHIIRDFQKDQLNNLNYFALDILEKYSLTPEDLKKTALDGRIPMTFREVIREYRVFADQYRSETEKVLESLEGRLSKRYMLSLRIIFHLYLKIFERIDPDNGTFTTAELNPSPEEVKAAVMECIREFREGNPELLTYEHSV